MKALRKPDIFERYRVWLKTPVEERVPVSKTELQKVLGVRWNTLAKWDKRIGLELEKDEAEGKKLEKMKQVIYKQALKGDNPKWAEMWLKMEGHLIEKREVDQTISLGAEEHHRIRQDAIRRVQEVNRDTDGIRGLLPESRLLSQQVCVDTEQEHSADSQMASVAVSEGTT